MTHVESSGDKILAARRAAKDEREKRIIIGVLVSIPLMIATGWFGWEIYNMAEDNIAIHQIQASQLVKHGFLHVETDEQIRQAFRRLEDQTGATRSEARGVVKAFHSM
jgi:hypothetical protein